MCPLLIYLSSTTICMRGKRRTCRVLPELCTHTDPKMRSQIFNFFSFSFSLAGDRDASMPWQRGILHVALRMMPFHKKKLRATV